MSIKRLKDAATVVAAIAGIVTGIEKVRITILKWKDEASEAKMERDARKAVEAELEKIEK